MAKQEQFQTILISLYSCPVEENWILSQKRVSCYDSNAQLLKLPECLFSYKQCLGQWRGVNPVFIKYPGEELLSEYWMYYYKTACEDNGGKTYS